MRLAEETTPTDQLVPGRRYMLELDDCCVKGHVEATFKAYERDTDDSTFITGIVFDVAQLENLYGWEAREMLPQEVETVDLVAALRASVEAAGRRRREEIERSRAEDGR